MQWFKRWLLFLWAVHLPHIINLDWFVSQRLHIVILSFRIVVLAESSWCNKRFITLGRTIVRHIFQSNYTCPISLQVSRSDFGQEATLLRIIVASFWSLETFIHTRWVLLRISHLLFLNQTFKARPIFPFLVIKDMVPQSELLIGSTVFTLS